jgi:hypothetical protein
MINYKPLTALTSASSSACALLDDTLGDRLDIGVACPDLLENGPIDLLESCPVDR